jgi:pheromone shutdown protein TraB
MVEDLCSRLRPDVVMLELCSERVDDILCCESASKKPISFTEAMYAAITADSLQDAVIGVVTWVQEHMSSCLGASMGSEQAAAFRYAKKLRIPTILGDRRHSITTQRIFDKMTFLEKLSTFCALCVDIITWPLTNSADYIQRSEKDYEFLKEEINEFTRDNKGLAEVLIAERDEYIAQSIIELVKLLDLKSSYSIGGYSDDSASCDHPIWPKCNKEVKVLAVMGLGHLRGVYRQICSGGASQERMRDISTSSKCIETTWPGEMHLYVVDSIE